MAGMTKSQIQAEFPKDRTQKYATEMTFEEFHTWATGYVLFAIGEGTPLREAMFMVVHQAAMNEVFGGRREGK